MPRPEIVPQAASWEAEFSPDGRKGRIKGREMRTLNRNCRALVDRCEPFTGSNLSGVKVTDKIYVVYSYGCYPLWACIAGKWYGHNSKHSQTTSCHQLFSKPTGEITFFDTVGDLSSIINYKKKVINHLTHQR